MHLDLLKMTILQVQKLLERRLLIMTNSSDRIATVQQIGLTRRQRPVPPDESGLFS